jgi:hypothetical protein
MGKKRENIINYFIKIIFQIICQNNIFNLREKKGSIAERKFKEAGKEGGFKCWRKLGLG